MSVAVHASVLVTLLLLFSSSREPEQAPVIRLQPERMVWIPDPRPAARGGGGTPLQKTPLAPVPPVTAPQAAPVIVEPETIVPEPEPQPTAPAAPSTAPSTAENTTGQSPGTGNTDGSGRGPDRGPGSGGTAFYGIGNGVSAPIPLRRPPPTYTAEAMRARLQGIVVLKCVVQPDGTCTDIQVMQSLDMTFGLDQQAIASARQWRFRPGMRLGEPVPVLVTLEIGFTIR